MSETEQYYPMYKENINHRMCLGCYSKHTYIDKLGRKRWYRAISGFLCSKCHGKITNNKYRERRAIYNSNRNHRK